MLVLVLIENHGSAHMSIEQNEAAEGAAAQISSTYALMDCGGIWVPSVEEPPKAS